MPSFDLALGLEMHRGAADMFLAFILEVSGQILCDVGLAVIAEKPGFVQNFCAAAGGRGQGDVERVARHCPRTNGGQWLAILGPHVATELPSDDVSRE